MHPIACQPYVTPLSNSRTGSFRINVRTAHHVEFHFGCILFSIGFLAECLRAFPAGRVYPYCKPALTSPLTFGVYRPQVLDAGHLLRCLLLLTEPTNNVSGQVPQMPSHAACGWPDTEVTPLVECSFRNA